MLGADKKLQAAGLADELNDASRVRRSDKQKNGKLFLAQYIDLPSHQHPSRSPEI